MEMRKRTSRRLYRLAEGGHSKSVSYHTYKDLKCAYPRRVQPHKAPGDALPCCWGTCCTAPTSPPRLQQQKSRQKMHRYMTKHGFTSFPSLHIALNTPLILAPGAHTLRNTHTHTHRVILYMNIYGKW